MPADTTENDDRIWLLNRRELGERYGVHESTVKRAVDRARELHEQDPEAHPEPPSPAATRPLRWWTDEFDAWWPTRPPMGRPVHRSEDR